MADLLAALALLTFAGVVGLIAVLIALYAFSLASEAVSRRKENDLRKLFNEQLLIIRNLR